MPNLSSERGEGHGEALKVDRLHVLVYPGFGVTMSGTVDERTQVLFDRYKRKAEEMQRDEFMFLLASHPPTTRSEHERYVHDRICELKEILRQRMTMLSHGKRLFFPKDIEEDLLRAKAVAGARGFVIDRSTVAVVYGETFHACVPAAARAVEDAFALPMEPVILAHETNIGYKKGETPEQERKRFAEIAPTILSTRAIVNWTVPKE